MILDASALLALVLREPDAERYARAIAVAPAVRLPSVTWFEASMRIDHGGGGAEALQRFDRFLVDFDIDIVPFTKDHAQHARAARLLYGKPHKAELNFGDCMVYGVAKHEREPLLFKGNDFSHTDIEPALKD